MPKNNSRNPSLFLTQQQVDDIADRILEGKYCKRPVKPEDVYHAGFNDAYHRSYIESRFQLTPTGITRRTNKFSGLVSVQMNRANRSVPYAVWKVKRGYYDSNGFTFVMGPGGTESEKTMLREGAMLMWGWLWLGDRPGMKADELSLELVGFGGNRELGHRLNGVVEYVSDRAKSKREELAKMQKVAEEFDTQAAMVSDMVNSLNVQMLDAQFGGR